MVTVTVPLKYVIILNFQGLLRVKLALGKVDFEAEQNNNPVSGSRPNH